MQDSFQANTNKIEPEAEKPQKKAFTYRQLTKPVIVAIGAILVISGYFIFSYVKKSEIEDARADVLNQAVMINNIESFTTYKGQAGGLYQGSKNSPELNQKILIQKQLQLIRPVDWQGVSSSEGKVGFVFIGEPYTSGEFEVLANFIEGNAQANQSLVLVDAAQSNLNVNHWNKSLFAWDVLSKKVQERGITANQVQILWINLGFDSYSENLDTDIETQADMLENIVKTALVKYPATKVVYLSSPRYAGLSKDANFQEPQAYEAAFALRELINRQERGVLLFSESSAASTTVPALVWGPYIWNNDTTGISPFGYKPESYVADGLILTIQGKQRLAVDLFDFWSSYEFSKVWFSP